MKNNSTLSFSPILRNDGDYTHTQVITNEWLQKWQSKFKRFFALIFFIGVFSISSFEVRGQTLVNLHVHNDMIVQLYTEFKVINNSTLAFKLSSIPTTWLPGCNSHQLSTCQMIPAYGNIPINGGGYSIQLNVMDANSMWHTFLLTDGIINYSYSFDFDPLNPDPCTKCTITFDDVNVVTYFQ